jgi:type IV pilus assembly protein PilC
MPVYTYSARAINGELKNATIEAPTREEAVAQLRKQRLNVVKIDEAAKKKKGGKVPMREIVIFTRQFSTMINSGLPLVQALDILAAQSENPALKDTTRQVVYDVESGNTVADALRKHPKAFTELYVNMVAAGEAGGILDTILKRLAVYIEKSVKLKGQVKSAMIYPIAVICIATIVVAAILWKVIPTFAQLFAGLGAQLPLPTRVVIAASNGLLAYGPIIFIALGGIGYALKRYYDTPGGRHMIDAIVLKMPILGMIMRKIAVARFCRTLSTLLSSGVPILDGLDITARTAGNAIIEEAIQKTRASIERGETVSAPLRETNVFPSMVVQMINVGETTGALDAMLAKIADFYEEEVDTAVAGLLTLMEPLMIAVLGGVVGGIVIAMYMPIFDLISKLT